MTANGYQAEPPAPSEEKVWQIAALAKRFVPPRCEKPVIGPAVNAFRRFVWKLLGLHHNFNTVLGQIEDMHLGRSWQFRPGTEDRAVFDSVVRGNEYGLPDSFGPDDIILDVGMHIGSFCYAALLRGAQHVYGFEADPGNFSQAVANLRVFGDRIHLYPKAVWRSDRTGDALFHPSSSGKHTGGGCILYPLGGRPLEAVPFDDILREVTDNGKKRVKLVKMDCEGSEFPILLTSRMLHLIDEIRGEYHEINDGRYDHTPIPQVARIAGVERFTITGLTECLEKNRFRVTSVRNGRTSLGLFTATRAA